LYHSVGVISLWQNTIFNQSQVELTPGVLCDKVAAAKARHASTATQCARILLLGVFDVETLLQSSLKGGANKRDMTAPSKRPLDDTKLTAIYS
jgi:hypothetical protein